MSILLRNFAAAIMYLTRLPVPARLTKDYPPISAIAPYFPLVGMIVGSVGAAVANFTMAVFPLEIAILLSMAATIYITGAFHEDGFADVCDGFGGSWEKDRILAIMKDSRVGSFATVGVILIMALKYQALVQIPKNGLVKSLIVGHTVSRAMPVVMSCFMINVRETSMRADEKPIFQSQTLLQGAVALFFGLLPMIVLHENAMYWSLVPLFAVTVLMARFFKRWIGGYTGDCCGAVQQVTEVVFYLSIIGIR